MYRTRVRMQLAIGCLLVACGGGSTSVDAQNLGTLVFEDRFDNFPMGWSGTSAVPGVRSETVGNPPPAMQFAGGSLTAIETSAPATYANQAMVATVEVMPLFDSDGQMMLRFVAGESVQPSQVVDYKVRRTNGVIAETSVNDAQVSNAEGFRTIRIRMDANGTTLEVDNDIVPWIPTPKTITTSSIYLQLAGDTSISPISSDHGTLYVDNVRLYRGP